MTLDIERISLQFTSRYYKDEHSVFFKTVEEAEEETHPKKEVFLTFSHIQTLSDAAADDV